MAAKSSIPDARCPYGSHTAAGWQNATPGVLPASLQHPLRHSEASTHGVKHRRSPPTVEAQTPSQQSPSCTHGEPPKPHEPPGQIPGSPSQNSEKAQTCSPRSVVRQQHEMQLPPKPHVALHSDSDEPSVYVNRTHEEPGQHVPVAQLPPAGRQVGSSPLVDGIIVVLWVFELVVAVCPVVLMPVSSSSASGSRHT